MPIAVSLSFGTVWIEMFLSELLLVLVRSLSFGTVWIEMSYISIVSIGLVVTVLRDGVD